MKVCSSLVFFLSGSLFCQAQEPPMVGTWEMVEQSIEYREEGSDRILERVSSALSFLDFLAGGTFTIGSESGNWLFSDDFMLAIEPGSVKTVAVNVTGDSFLTAETKVEDLAGGVLIRKSNFNIGVKPPASPFTAPQVAGDWVLFQQKMEYRDASGSGVTVRTLQEVNQSRIDLDLDPGGTFQAEVITDTDEPAEVGNLINGTWLMNAGELQATVGTEVTLRSHFSSGGDLLVHAEEEENVDGTNINYSSQIDLWIKKPASLTTADIVGCWGVAGMTTDLEVDAGGGGQILDRVGSEGALAEFRADGTGMRRIVVHEDPARIGTVENFTWLLDGNELLFTAASGTFRFVVSAEKDLALMQKFEANLVAGSESFDFFGLAKLPNAPGFGGMPMSIVLLEATGGLKPVLEIPTVSGLRYQVEVSEDLSGWQSLGPIMLGTGGTISSNLPVLPGEAEYFRWRILPPIAPPN